MLEEIRKKNNDCKAILEKYKKVILNYLLIILKLKNTLAKNLEEIEIINNRLDSNQIKKSCTKMRNRLIDHHAKVSHKSKGSNDFKSLKLLYGPETTYMDQDKIELYCGFYIGLLICILHSDYKDNSSESIEINNLLNHFFTKAEDKKMGKYDPNLQQPIMDDVNYIKKKILINSIFPKIILKIY